MRGDLREETALICTRTILDPRQRTAESRAIPPSRCPWRTADLPEVRVLNRPCASLVARPRISLDRGILREQRGRFTDVKASTPRNTNTWKEGFRWPITCVQTHVSPAFARMEVTPSTARCPCTSLPPVNGHRAELGLLPDSAATRGRLAATRSCAFARDMWWTTHLRAPVTRLRSPSRPVELSTSLEVPPCLCSRHRPNPPVRSSSPSSSPIQARRSPATRNRRWCRGFPLLAETQEPGSRSPVRISTRPRPSGSTELRRPTPSTRIPRSRRRFLQAHPPDHRGHVQLRNRNERFSLHRDRRRRPASSLPVAVRLRLESPCTSGSPCLTFARAYQSRFPGASVQVTCGGGSRCSFRRKPSRTRSPRPASSPAGCGNVPRRHLDDRNNTPGCATYQPASRSHADVASVAVEVPYVQLSGLAFAGSRVRRCEHRSDVTSRARPGTSTTSILSGLSAPSFTIDDASYMYLAGRQPTVLSSTRPRIVSGCKDSTRAATPRATTSRSTASRMHDYRQTQIGAHMECIHFQAADNSVIVKSKFLNCAQQDISFQTKYGRSTSTA